MRFDGFPSGECLYHKIDESCFFSENVHSLKAFACEDSFGIKHRGKMKDITLKFVLEFIVLDELSDIVLPFDTFWCTNISIFFPLAG